MLDEGYAFHLGSAMSRQGKQPAFLFYAQDWLADWKVRSLTPEARGIYLDLLCHSWLEGGLPDDLSHISRILAVDLRVIKRVLVLENLLQFWPKSEDGLRRNPKLEEVRKQAARTTEVRSEAGKAGAAARWQTHAYANADAKAKVWPSSSSSSSEKKKNPLTPKSKKPGWEGEIPRDLNSVPFRGAWEEFLKHRADIRKPVTQTNGDAMLKRLLGWGESRAISALEHTTFKGWQGLREPEGDDAKSEKPHGPPSTAVREALSLLTHTDEDHRNQGIQMLAGWKISESDARRMVQ